MSLDSDSTTKMNFHVDKFKTGLILQLPLPSSTTNIHLSVGFVVTRWY